MKFTEITSAKDVRRNLKNIPATGGVYKHFIDEQGLKLLMGVEPTQEEISKDGKTVYLVYIGLAKNIQYRFKWHLGEVNVSHSCIKHGTLSTLRLTYMSNHKDINCLSQQEKLNRFIDNHVYLSHLETPDYVLLEDELIKNNDVPLNIKGNKHPFIKLNKQRRKEIKAKYNSTTSFQGV
jgi:hypothetical protein